MSRPIIPSLVLLVAISIACASTALSYEGPLADVFADASSRFQPASLAFFEQSQRALTEEVVRVGGLLESESEDYAQAWKSHLRWSLLKSNLGPVAEVNLDELQLVRRWLYSNREGLESELFKQLRSRLDAYLDAVYALQHPNLKSAFDENVALVRQQCQDFERDPSDRQAEALGRTLGWFEQTAQLAEEIAMVRKRVSASNLELIVSADLVERMSKLLQQDVSESMPVSDTMQVPQSRPRQRTRTMQLTGEATSMGQVSVGLAPNEDAIEFILGFQGRVHADCRATTGPVALTLITSGTVVARKSVFLNSSGFELGPTSVVPHVTGRITEVDGRRNIAERIGTRRSSQPDMRDLTNRRAHEKTRTRVQLAFDERVDDALQAMRANTLQNLESFSGFTDLLAPVAREGAVPVVDKMSSPGGGIDVRVTSARRSQLAAIHACPNHLTQADIAAHVHVSFFNNTTETMLGGKRLSDKFFMKYAELVHDELPWPLIVQASSPRWGVRASQRRPIELQTTGLNELQFRLRFDALDIEGTEYEGKSTFSITYELQQDDSGKVRLQRNHDLQLETQLPAAQAEFLRSKIEAFFSPVLAGAGKLSPSGDALGLANQIESVGVTASDGWIIAGWNIPDSIFEELVQSRRKTAASENDEVAAEL